MTGQAIREFAPAKVNLSLNVGPLQADGYHPVDSLVVFADWGDVIFAEPAPEGLHLSVSGAHAAALESEAENLVLKAAYALRAAAGRPELSARIVLEKALPVAAGLGGGSADAAATLRAVCHLWELDFGARQLAEIGSVLGSDVPACVYSRPLLMRGRGERVSPLLAWPDLHGVVVNPGVPVATGPVFAAYDKTEPQALVPGAMPIAGHGDAAVTLTAALKNDLQAPAIAMVPEIGTVLDALEGLPGCRVARMSGSGASCFGLFDDEPDARTAADEVAAQNPSWLVQPVNFASALV